MPPVAVGAGLIAAGAIAKGVAGRNTQNAQADQYNANRDARLAAADATSDQGLLNYFGEDNPIGQHLRSNDPLVNYSNTSSSSTTRKFVQDEYKPEEGKLKDFWNNMMSGDKFSAEGIAKLNALMANDTYGNIENVLGDKMAAMGLSPEAGGAGLGAVEAARGRDIVRGRLGAERESLAIQQQGAQGLQNLLALAGIGQRTNSSSSTRSWSEGGLAPGQQVLLDAYMRSNLLRGDAGAPASRGSLLNSILGGAGDASQQIGGAYLGKALAG